MDDGRMVKTKFWSDEYIADLEPSEKLLYLYLITNERTSLCGCYEISRRIISFDTGLVQEKILEILKKFESDGKVFYVDNHIFLKNFIKNQNLANPSIRRGIEKRIDDLPLEIRKIVQEVYQKVSSGYLVGTKGREGKGKESKRKGKEEDTVSSTSSTSPFPSDSELEGTASGPKGTMPGPFNAAGFSDFWAAYPRKIKRNEASTAWESRGLDRPERRGTVQLILDFIAKASKTDTWKKSMIPCPAKFIEEERWKDDLATYADWKPPERAPSEVAML